MHLTVGLILGVGRLCYRRLHARDEDYEFVGTCRRACLVLAMHDVDGYTLNELNIMLDIPIGTLKSRLHRARAQMKSLLKTEPSGGLIR